jgi:hypothetical protein
MKVAIYARVSTDDQNCALQLEALRAHCKRWEFEVVKEYVDAGYSGRLATRPALDRLMGDARERRFDAVIVWKIDRFGALRQELHPAPVHAGLLRGGVRVDERADRYAQVESDGGPADAYSHRVRAVRAIDDCGAREVWDGGGEAQRRALRAPKESGGPRADPRHAEARLLTPRGSE